MTEGGARRLGTSVGGIVAARVTGRHTALRLKLTGLVSTPDPSPPYWWGDGAEDFPLGLSTGGAGSVAATDPLIASPATSLAVPAQDVPTAMGQLPLRPGAVGLGNESTVKRVLANTVTSLSSQRIRAGTQLPSLVAKADHQRHAMSTIVAIAAVQLVLETIALPLQSVAVLRAEVARRAGTALDRLGLDEHWRQVVLDELVVHARRGAIVIVASGDAEVTNACDRVLSLTVAGAADQPTTSIRSDTRERAPER
jgi:hypothetical protein